MVTTHHRKRKEEVRDKDRRDGTSTQKWYRDTRIGEFRNQERRNERRKLNCYDRNTREKQEKTTRKQEEKAYMMRTRKRSWNNEGRRVEYRTQDSPTLEKRD